jgi:hypothetical protein
MERKAVSAAFYLDELNRRLRAHPDYKPGMLFEVQRTGFIRKPHGHMKPFAEVSKGVRDEFVIAAGRPHAGSGRAVSVDDFVPSDFHKI